LANTTKSEELQESTAGIVPPVITEPGSVIAHTAGNGALPPLTLEELRARFFEGGAKAKILKMDWNGIEFDWRQPTIEETQKAQDEEDQNFMVTLLIRHSYMSGTDQKLFTNDDYDMLVKMPLSGEFQAIVRAIGQTMDLKVEEKAKK